MDPNTILIWGILIGFILDRIVPFSIQGWKKFYYRRLGVQYFEVYMIEGQKILDKLLIKQSQNEFTYNKGKYITKISTGKTKITDPNTNETKEIETFFTPALDLKGEKILFYNRNNALPLIFKEDIVTPKNHDPEIFMAMIENQTINESLSSGFDIDELKRFISRWIIIAIACVSFAVYLIQMKGGA